MEQPMSETTVSQAELTEAIRLAIQDRATWFYLLIKEFKAAGYATDEPVRKAIFKFGQMKGRKIGTASTPKAFFDGIGTPNARLAFEMEDVGVDGQRGAYRFHHCALVEAWKNLGASKEEIAELCDLASCGDHGVISCSPELELKFNAIIAKGDAYCELEVTRKQ
jgi:hypothetical protein